MFAPVFSTPEGGNRTINAARVRFEQVTGISIVFTNAAGAAGVFPSALTLSHPYTHPNSSLGPTLVFENVIFVNNYSPYQNFAAIPHEIGHTFQLQHVLGPLNLMCGPTGSYLDFLTSFYCTTSTSVQLNATQIRSAQGAAKQWQ
jgi:hypothetical protein